ncbi:MAG: hypothetical protein M9916_13510 [Crocinitomicaceae bacterium]|nr:hypothetical protein [Crocinitomicaceae bacterium]
MKWVALSTVFFTGMIKFMFAPTLGPLLNLTYFETYIANGLGALVIMTICFYAADYFCKLTIRRRKIKTQKAIIEGKSIAKKKIFTRRNKLIVRFKNKVGLIPFSLFAPYFLSIPIGSIIVAKFFGRKKKTFPWMIVGLLLTNFISVSVVYLLKYEAESLF